MKYEAPAGCNGVSVGGEQFNTDAEGFITVPDDGDYAALLAPHGFTPVPPASAAEVPAAEAVTEEAPKATTKKAKAAAEVPAAE